MKKQIRYKDEDKASILFLFLSLLFEKYKYRAIKKWIHKLKLNKLAIANRKSVLKLGTKYKGRIIKTEITAHDEVGSNLNDKTVYEYYAVIEFVNDKGEKTTFTTEELNGNPEFLSTKEVTVYSFDSVEYATDFGYIIEPKDM